MSPIITRGFVTSDPAIVTRGYGTFTVVVVVTPVTEERPRHRIRSGGSSRRDGPPEEVEFRVSVVSVNDSPLAVPYEETRRFAVSEGDHRVVAEHLAVGIVGASVSAALTSAVVVPSVDSVEVDSVSAVPADGAVRLEVRFALKRDT